MENQSNKNGTQQDDHSIFKQDTEQHTQSTKDPIYKILIVIGGLLGLGTLAGIFLPAIILAIGMGLTDNPNRFKFELPYNAIDFQKIAYIDNQFVMYGIDYNSDGREHNLVIFNSKNGESWTKSTITASESDVISGMTNTGSTFTYFNHQCMLIGAYSRILVAHDCKNWHYQTPPQITIGKRNIFNFLYSATGAVVINNTLYVSSGRSSSLSGIFSTIDGIHWQQESLPRPGYSDSRDLRDGFSSIAVGNNKIIALGIWKQPQGKPLTVIYTKDLATNKWSYEIYPEYITNLTRGRDRFVGMTESNALVLVDGNNVWGKYQIKDSPVDLAYGLSGKYIGIGLLDLSDDGITWKTILLNDKSTWLANKLSCNSHKCIAVGSQYRVVVSDDGISWDFENFNLQNPKLHWWRRFF